MTFSAKPRIIAKVAREALTKDGDVERTVSLLVRRLHNDGALLQAIVEQEVRAAAAYSRRYRHEATNIQGD